MEPLQKVVNSNITWSTYKNLISTTNRLKNTTSADTYSLKILHSRCKVFGEESGGGQKVKRDTPA